MTDAFLHLDRDTWSWMYTDYIPTDWISDTQFIADHEILNMSAHYTTSVLVDVGTHEVTEYIPESSRYNWSGVISPDGSSIAFMSAPASGNGASALYTVALGSDNPIQVPSSLPDSVDNHGKRLLEPLGEGTCVTLLDWR